MLIGFLYAVFATVIIGRELSRKKWMQYDQLSVLNTFFLAYLVVPAAILHMFLDTGFAQADRIADFSLLGYLHHRAEPLQKAILFLGSVLAYCGLSIGYKLLAPRTISSDAINIDVNSKLCFTWIFIGFVFSALMFVFGDSLLPGDPIGGLLLSTYYRAEDPFYAFERTPLNANIYAATSTFLFFSVLGFALSNERRRNSLIYLAYTLVFVLLDTLASGARRNLLIAALLVYLYIAVRKGRYKIHYLVSIFIVSIPFLVFGKAILRNLSDLEVANIGFSDVTLMEQFIGATGDIGQSYLESIGTIALYAGGPRYGMDHLFSVLRMIPLGMMGIEEPWPKRIVRISTEYQSGDATMQDIPPGYLGQCWIDLPVVGFFLMPLLHGIGFGLVERSFRSINLRKSPFYLMAYLIAGYLVSMPLNSGTLDFVCSPDIVLTVLLFYLLHFLNTRHLGLAMADKRRPRIENVRSIAGAVATNS